MHGTPHLRATPASQHMTPASHTPHTLPPCGGGARGRGGCRGAAGRGASWRSCRQRAHVRDLPARHLGGGHTEIRCLNPRRVRCRRAMPLASRPVQPLGTTAAWGSGCVLPPAEVRKRRREGKDVFTLRDTLHHESCLIEVSARRSGARCPCCKLPLRGGHRRRLFSFLFFRSAPTYTNHCSRFTVPDLYPTPDPPPSTRGRPRPRRG